MVLRTVILVPRYGVYDPRRNQRSSAYSSRAVALLYYSKVPRLPRSPTHVQLRYTLTTQKGLHYMLTTYLTYYRSLSVITYIDRSVLMNNDLHILMGFFNGLIDTYSLIRKKYILFVSSDDCLISTIAQYFPTLEQEA